MGRTFRGAAFTYDVRHVGGVAWRDAPAPPRRHTHYVQTVGTSPAETVERCPCGALRRTTARTGRGEWLQLETPRVAARRPALERLAGLFRRTS